MDSICRTYSIRPSNILDPYYELNSFERIYLDFIVMLGGLEENEGGD